MQKVFAGNLAQLSAEYYYYYRTIFVELKKKIMMVTMTKEKSSLECKPPDGRGAFAIGGWRLVTGKCMIEFSLPFSKWRQLAPREVMSVAPGHTAYVVARLSWKPGFPVPSKLLC